MLPLINKQSAVKFAAVLFLSVQIGTLSCKKNSSDQQPQQSNDPTIENVIDQAGSATPPYDLNALLQGNSGLGLIKFRQDPDTARIVDLNTWLFDLKPNHTYLLQRAVNPITDTSQCTSTAWLTLGRGTVPQSIHTDNLGYGHEDLFRNLSAVPRGTRFYIHFQIMDSASSETVLASDCYTFTVR